MRYYLKRDSGGLSMGMEVATLDEVIDFAILALDEQDDVILQDSETGKTWLNDEILEYGRKMNI